MQNLKENIGIGSPKKGATSGANRFVLAPIRSVSRQRCVPGQLWGIPTADFFRCCSWVCNFVERTRFGLGLKRNQRKTSLIAGPSQKDRPIFVDPKHVKTLFCRQSILPEWTKLLERFSKVGQWSIERVPLSGCMLRGPQKDNAISMCPSTCSPYSLGCGVAMTIPTVRQPDVQLKLSQLVCTRSAS